MNANASSALAGTSADALTVGNSSAPSFVPGLTPRGSPPHEPPHSGHALGVQPLLIPPPPRPLHRIPPRPGQRLKRPRHRLLLAGQLAPLQSIQGAAHSLNHIRLVPKRQQPLPVVRFLHPLRPVLQPPPHRLPQFLSRN